MKVLDIVFIALVVVAIVFSIAAISTPVIFVDLDVGVKIRLTLWKQTQEIGGKETSMNLSELSCKPVVKRLQAAAAMGIISIFVGGAFAAMATLLAAGKRLFPSIALLAPAMFASLLCIIAWVLEVSVFSVKFEGDKPGDCREAVKDLGDAKLSASFAFFIINSLFFPVIGVAMWFFNRKQDGFTQV